jgi:hypothetical protein
MTIENEYQEDSLLMFRGVLTVNLISILGNHLRLLISYDSKIFQKIFKIFVEVTQNVYYYSAENHEISDGIRGGAGWVSVQESESEYRVTTGNHIKPEHAPKLIQYCNEINSMDEEQLRKLKRETRSQAMVRDTGAHIGLIQTSIVSGNKLKFKIVENSVSGLEFILTTTITKELM